ncbi:branched-chain amino acid ABC transporter permease [Ammoniphilus sp. CFH 90114]|uniref:branched-chain amino acid ABC transporter permease n=1 Tax=Ammoniphilus sp. CFH 90114 TaxID=2493665 RepID=UPI00100EDC77|nr:branched-chain amino acid ABC transporter permease [Ammoniphilus sp. CFH 90114]RXT08909.1 branched-chain amino acid ABC transporter permease [Ammoniphilus sp. CFH 90114]
MFDMLFNPYYLQIFIFILINCMLALSMYLPLSTGQLSLGAAGFMSIGAYTSALLTMKLGFPMPIGIVTGGLMAGFIGVLIGIPALRLSGVYLAICTLGFGEMVRVIFNNLEITNGALGLSGIPQLGQNLSKMLKEMGIQAKTLGLTSPQLSSLLTILVLLLLLVLVFLFIYRQGQSRVGRAFEAIRADESAAQAMGINITYYKVLAFAQGAVLAGMAGAIFAHVTFFISPVDFDYHKAVDILIFAVLGGSEVIWGPLLGATLLTLLPEALRFASDYRMMIFGTILVLMMIFRPQGFLDANLLRALTSWRKPNQKTDGQSKEVSS